MSRYYAPNLQTIEEAVGTAAALQLAQAYGGTVVYIPASPREDHWLSLLVGHDGAQRIACLFGGRGRKIVIPLGPCGGQRGRLHRAILDGLKDGLSTSTIARATGTHERTIRRHRHRARNDGDKLNGPQGELF